MYHHVSDDIEAPTVVSSELLEEHITAISDAGLQVMSLAELSSWLGDPGTTASGVVLTFDDGYDSFYHKVFPLTSRYQIPASCFLIVSSSEAPADPASGLTAVPGHLSHEQVREMSKTGLTEIGSHSYDGHRYVDTLGGSKPYLVEPLVDEDHAGFLNRVKADLNMSRQALSSMTGTECLYFSYPYGWVTSALRDQVSQCGFDLALTTRPGAVVPGMDRYLLPRMTVRPEMTGADVVEAIRTEMERAVRESRLSAGICEDKQLRSE
jgi:peptidoglycan/xylan/chitin deacetylase (PgdA/CDA1 family)